MNSATSSNKELQNTANRPITTEELRETHVRKQTSDTRLHRRTGVLVFADYYLPGFKAGGPIRTLANIMEQLGDEFEFRIVTRDRDYGDRSPYPGILTNCWQAI